jgi:hypothetical protein
LRLVIRHLTRGLIYRNFLLLLPAFPGTVFSLFWQLVNLYGSLPALILTLIIFQSAAILAALLIVTASLFATDFRVAFTAATVVIVILILTWAIATLNANRRLRLRLYHLHYSTRTALILVGLLLCHRVPELKLSPGMTFWEMHIKPSRAGNLAAMEPHTIAQTIAADYRRARELLGPEGVIFGCSPGSFVRLMQEAGLDANRYTVWKTVIPARHSRVFGRERPFYFYIIQ